MHARSARIAQVVLVLALWALPRTVEAQAPRFLNIVGFGAVGGGVGALATSGAECSGTGFICIPAEFVMATIGGAVAGMLVGNSVASSANRTVGEGRSPGTASLTALSVGSALGGAALGALAGGMLVNDDGTGTFLGSDEQTIVITGLAGAALGILQLSRRWEALTGHAVEVRPTVAGGGRAGVNLTVRF